MMWNDLLFINFSIAPERIQQRLPPGMQVDTFQGMAYVSIVPMTLQQFSVKGLPPVFKKKFLECNVRTYVTVNQEPGIYFFSLDANSLPEVLGARWLFNLNYRFRRMRFLAQHQKYSFTILSGLTRSSQTQIHAKIGPEVESPDALLQFCTNRNTYFVNRRKRLYKGYVMHEPWAFNAITQFKLETTLIARTHKPVQVFYSKGLAVKASFLMPAIRPIIFYDGSCGFCNRAIRLLLALDRKAVLYAAPLHGKTFKTLYTHSKHPDRIMCYDQAGFTDGAHALLNILNYLPWYFKGFKVLNVVPKRILNALYDLMAKHRHFCERPKTTIQMDRVME